MNKKDLSERDICSKFIGPAKYLRKPAIMMIRYCSCYAMDRPIRKR
jgi:hypothetical protein